MGQESNIARTFDAINSIITDVSGKHVSGKHVSIITAVAVAIAMHSEDFSLRSSSFKNVKYYFKLRFQIC